jgi:dephospho-CoA kinase
MTDVRTNSAGESSVPVIGIAGGIGSGKSAVARALGELGCGVIDADAIAREAMRRPDVIDTLRQWWGPRVLKPDGAVDRAVVGRIVFDAPDQRQRLEALIHPLVHAERHRLREAMRRDGAVRAIVEDAPLLYEAGIDRECDVVLFVDAPRALRLQRLQRSRGWDEAELARREKNQIALDIKRNRADHVLVNDAGEADLLDRVRRVLSEIFHPRATSR